MNIIQDFRINEKNCIQLKVCNSNTNVIKWVNLVTFKDDCTEGKYGFKDDKIKKPFNPYIFFNKTETEKIHQWQRK